MAKWISYNDKIINDVLFLQILPFICRKMVNNAMKVVTLAEINCNICFLHQRSSWSLVFYTKQTFFEIFFIAFILIFQTL